MNFKDFSTNPTAPAIDPFVVTPNDSTDLPRPIRGFHCGTSGNVTVIAPNGSTIAYNGLVAGQFYPYAATRVMATGTTVTDIVGLR